MAERNHQIQAAINAVHSDASTASETDWGQIVEPYNQHITIAPSQIVELNRAVAVGEADGPTVALALVDALSLEGYYLYHAIRADLLRRLGRDDEAARAYEVALSYTENAAEREHLQRRRASLTPS